MVHARRGSSSLQHVRTRIPGRCYPARWIGCGGTFFWPARSPDLNPLDFYVWGHLRCLVYETTAEREDDLLPRIQAAYENIRHTRYFRVSATVRGESLRVVQWSRWSSLWTAAVVVAVLMLKCLIIIILCQCYLCTIKISSINYERDLQSRFETSFLPSKKALSTVPCYLR
jgi:hypothetical protein